MIVNVLREIPYESVVLFMFFHRAQPAKERISRSGDLCNVNKQTRLIWLNNYHYLSFWQLQVISRNLDWNLRIRRVAELPCLTPNVITLIKWDCERLDFFLRYIYTRRENWAFIIGNEICWKGSAVKKDDLKTICFNYDHFVDLNLSS